MHFRAPSIDHGVMAFIWALLLSAYVYSVSYTHLTLPTNREV